MKKKILLGFSSISICSTLITDNNVKVINNGDGGDTKTITRIVNYEEKAFYDFKFKIL